MSAIHEIVAQIQVIARNVLELDRPAEVTYGKMVDGRPTIRLSQKLTITGDQVILPKPFVFYNPPSPGPDEDPPPPPEWYQIMRDDAVVLLRNRHGQNYILLGKR